MAIYEYTCGVCNSSVSMTRSVSDPEEYYKCKTCKIPLRRVYSNIGVAFSGSGFYSTDK